MTDIRRAGKRAAFAGIFCMPARGKPYLARVLQDCRICSFDTPLFLEKKEDMQRGSARAGCRVGVPPNPAQAAILQKPLSMRVSACRHPKKSCTLPAHRPETGGESWH